MKTLLKIDLVKDDICSSELDCETKRDYDRIGAAIVGLMSKDKTFANTVIQYAAFFLRNINEIDAVEMFAERLAEIKTKN